MTKVTDKQIIEAAQSSQTMREAARKIGVHLSSFIPRAKKLGVYITNQSRKGITRSKSEYINKSTPLQEILEGKHPYYSTSTLHRRLVKAGIKKDICEKCNEKDISISYELDHIDGNNTNHVLTNLRILCPNCHSKTPTHSGKNRKIQKRKTHDLAIVELICRGHDTRHALHSLGMLANGVNYKRVERLREVVEYIQYRNA